MRVQERPQDSPQDSSQDGSQDGSQGSAPQPAKVSPDQAQGLYRVGLAYGRFIYRVRWIVLILWFVGLAISVPFAAKVSSALSGTGYSFSGSESIHADNLISSKLHTPASSVQVVFQSPSTPVGAADYQQEINGFIASAKTFAHVTGVYIGAPGQDGRTIVVNVTFDQGSDAVGQQLPALKKLVPSGGPATAYITGEPAVASAFNTITEQDTSSAEEKALPLALLVLIIVFGSLIAAALPLLLALVAVPTALAIIYAIALHTQTTVFVLNIASIVGLGVSIDYSLFMVRRFRDELRLGRPLRDAVGWTVATSGEAILFSGLVVMIGFAGLLLIGVPFMTSFGIGGAVVVAVAVLAALTLLPALLSVLGPRVNALRIPILGRLLGVGSSAPVATAPAADADAQTPQSDEGHGFWHVLALAVMRRPVVIIAVVLVALLALGWPALSLNIGSANISSLPKNVEARQGYDILTAQYPSLNQNPIEVVVQTPDGSSILTAANLAKVNTLSQWLDAQGHVTGTTSLTMLPSGGQPALSAQQLITLYSTGAYQRVPALAQVVAETTNGDTTVITLSTNTTLDSAPSKNLITTIRAGDRAQAGGLNVYVGGSQAISLDFNNYLYGNFPHAILFILIATYLLLLLMFRSVVLPLKAIVMNILSVGAAYGVMVMVFQWGWLSSTLGFQADGFIDSTIPILLFCILFGLSMDYEVFLLSRIHEEWLLTKNNRRAVARGLEKTGGVITNAALLFVIVTGAFTFTRITITKEIGLGMTVAVLVDASIIRSLLVPATMRLIGRWNWWLPGFPVPPKQVE